MRNADWGVATDTGLHRDHNEDAYLARPAMFAVADGMGGHQAGEVASAMAVAVLDRTAVLDEFTAEDISVGRPAGPRRDRRDRGGRDRPGRHGHDASPASPWSPPAAASTGPCSTSATRGSTGWPTGC